MDYRDGLSAGLPAPRDDDPAGLRRDIVDELADHLACASNRERLGGSEGNEAWQRVLERFGDPAVLARRLWFDAIGGKLMAQRVLLATCLVMSLASLSLAGAIWIQGNRDRAQAQAGQLEMAKQLRAISEEIKGARSLDWNPVTFQLTEETPDGPPAAGFSVTWSDTALPWAGGGGMGMGGGFGGTGGGIGGMGGASRSTSSTHVSDRSGMVELGLVHPGHYYFQVAKNWDQGSAATSGKLVVQPGSQVRQRIVCPKLPLERGPVRIRTDWPADLEKEGLVLDATFMLEPPSGWSFSPSRMPRGDKIRHSVVYGPGALMTEVLGYRYIWGSESGKPIWADLHASGLRDIRDPVESLQWERGTYTLAALYVLRPRPPTDGERLRHFEIVVASFVPRRNLSGTELSFWVRDKPPTEEEFGPALPRNRGAPREERRETADAPLLNLPGEYWSKTAAGFEVRPAQVNEWTIPLPDALIATVRESLKAAR